jgi:DNA-binding GntR family transcriptional regulator
MDSRPSAGRGQEALAGVASQKVARPAPLRMAVYDALLELIINGSLEPGQHLVEGELAEHLGVSRQPIREALQRLQPEGWVDLVPGHGAFVHTPTSEEAAQLLSVRSVLETYSARLAAENATREDVEQLWELQQQGLDAMADDDTKRLVTANSELHACITRISGNEVLAQLIAQVDRRVRWYYRPIARPRGKDAWNEHARLIRAIAQGNADRAGDIMERHTQRTTAVYRKQHETPDASTSARRA